MKSSQSLLLVAAVLFAVACWWLLSDSPGEAQNVSVEKAELTAADIHPPAQENARALLSAPPKEGDIERELAFDPLNSATYRVRVLQEGTDRPCANFALSITAYDPPTEKKIVSQSGRTDESGWWSTKIPTGPINLSQGVKFPSFEHGCRMSERIVATKGEVIERVIHAPPLFRYGLLIQGPNGEPVANHTVQIDSTSNGHSPDKYEFALHEKYSTDAAGKVFAAFIPGQFQATIASQRTGFAPAKFNAELRAANHNGVQIIQLLRLKKVHVLVQDRDRNPLPKVELQVAFQSSPLANGIWTPTRWPLPKPQVTDAKGRAVLKMAQTPQGQIQARLDGFHTTLASVDAKQENVIMTLGLDGGLRGRVVDENHAPIEEAKVRIWVAEYLYPQGIIMSRGPGGLYGWETVTTNAKGEFHLPVMPGNGFMSLMVQAHTGPDPVIITLGTLAPGFAVVEFELIEAPVIWPLADVNVMMVTFPHGSMSRQSIGQADSKGLFRSQAVARNNGYFMFYDQGYFPALVMLETLPDGFSKQKVYMERASSRIIHIVAADGLLLRPGTILDTPDFRAGIILENGLVLCPGGMKVTLFRRGLQKLSRYGLEDYPDDILEYLAFPPHGAVLRLQEGEAGMSIDFPIPAGFEEYTVTLDTAQLRALGLRD